MNQDRYVPTNKDFRNFMQFYVGQLISTLGSSIISFVIIWFITVTYADPIFLSITYFFAMGTQVLIGPVAGVFADRWDRKKVMFFADTLIALGTLLYLLLFSFQSRIEKPVFIWLLISVVFFRNIISPFQWTASSAIIPLMVPKDKLSRLNGFRNIAWGAINIVGPAIGAILYSIWPLNGIMFLDTVTYLVALIPLFLLKIPKLEKKEKKISESRTKNSFFSEFKEGLKFLMSTKGLLALFLIATFINFFEQPLFVLRPLFVNAFHGGTEKDLAWIVAMGQIGMFVSGTVVIFKKSWKKKTVLLMIALYVQIGGFLVQSLAPQGLIWVMSLGAMIMGFTYPFTNTMLNTIAQILVPPEMQGRMSSILSTLCTLLLPVAMIVSGPLANAIGYVPLFVGSIILGTISITIIWVMSKMKEIDPVVEKMEEEERRIREQKEEIEKIERDTQKEPQPVPVLAD